MPSDSSFAITKALKRSELGSYSSRSDPLVPWGSVELLSSPFCLLSRTLLTFFPPPLLPAIRNSPMEEELLRRIMQGGGGGGMDWERSYPQFTTALPANSPPSTPTPSTSSSSSILHSLPLHVVSPPFLTSAKFNGYRMSIANLRIMN